VEIVNLTRKWKWKWKWPANDRKEGNCT